MDELDRLGRELAGADTAVALTGAGVSTASGVPAFRTEDGVWAEFDEADFHYGRFRRDPAGFWRDRLDLHDAMFPGEVEPNAAHDALAGLETDGALDAVVTQNTDGLHADAGQGTVVELHGNAHRVVCVDCGRRAEAKPVHERVRDGEAPPTCAECGGVFKPDVVLFGEQLPRSAMERARGLAAGSDVFLAVGSSIQVEPAASLPRQAADSGATLAVVNLERTPVTDLASVDLRADVTEVLPALHRTVEERL